MKNSFYDLDCPHYDNEYQREGYTAQEMLFFFLT